ncbi:MAG TPA: prolyl oligopeptidase family serine peptidase [Terracidiphilus sp.]|jgi:prolyl oligopeptidase|nr:prolyl oligopeptidase family serine peptidase [Terracidiphilus sp.]
MNKFSSALCAAWIGVNLANPLAVSLVAQTTGASPPQTVAQETSAVLHGVTVADPYQWLEDGASPATRNWITSQQQYTESLLLNRPGMAALRRQVRELVDVEEIHRVLFRRNHYFIERKPAGQQQASIFVREGLSGAEKLLIDPAIVSTDHSDTVELLNVSADARLLAYGVRHGGRDQLSIHFRDLESGIDLTDVLPEARYLYWSLPIAPDRSAVYYVRFEDAGPRIYIHRFGQAVVQDTLLYGEQLDAQKLLAASLSPDGAYLLVTVLHGASGATDLYVKDLRSRSPFQTVVAGIDATFNGSIEGHTLYILTNWRAGNGQIFIADLAHPEQAHWKILVPEQKSSTLETIALTSDRLVVNSMRDAHSELQVFAFDGKQQPAIPLPALGSVALVDPDSSSPTLCFSFTSFSFPMSFHSWAPGDASGPQSISTGSVPPGLRDIVVEQVWYNSTGGVRVPMFLAHRRDVQPNGDLPVLLYGYGGFNWAQLPTFSAEEAVWMERGGVYAVANIRGGNEFGEAWHRAGELEQKQNCFDDFANAARWLVANHYTQPQRLAIQGLSNGGLLVTASITQHPELFGAAIGRYPLIDMIRYERFSIARWWVSEYGSVSDTAQFKTLYAYSPYHHVVKGQSYPAVLLITGDGDTRVDPSHSRKMTAMLQDATSSGKPVLLLYDSKSGHSGSLPASAEIEQSASELEFLNWQLHLPELP